MTTRESLREAIFELTNWRPAESQSPGTEAQSALEEMVLTLLKSAVILIDEDRHPDKYGAVVNELETMYSLLDSSTIEAGRIPRIERSGTEARAAGPQGRRRPRTR